MKRLSTIVILLIATLSVVSAVSQTLNLTAEIAAVEPTFDLVGSFNSDFSGNSNASASMGGSATLNYAGSSKIITAYFRVFQHGVAKSTSMIDYSISAGPMKSSTNATSTLTANSVFVSQLPAEQGTRTVSMGAYNLSVTGLAGNGNYRLNYEGTIGKPFASVEYLAEAVFKWDISSFPADSYSADVILTISGS